MSRQVGFVLLIVAMIGVMFYLQRTPAWPWSKDYAGARAVAEARGKPLLLVFSASWCPPCQQMKRNTWPDPDLQQLVNDRFVAVYIDVDHRANHPVAARHAIDVIPTIVVAASDGEPIGYARSGYVGPDELSRWLQAAPAPGE